MVLLNRLNKMLDKLILVLYYVFNRLNNKKERSDTVGYKIKEVRESLNMTQEELSEKSGVSRGIISALENGHPITTTKTLVKLARAMNVSIDKIFFADNV